MYTSAVLHIFSFWAYLLNYAKCLHSNCTKQKETWVYQPLFIQKHLQQPLYKANFPPYTWRSYLATRLVENDIIKRWNRSWSFKSSNPVSKLNLQLHLGEMLVSVSVEKLLLTASCKGVEIPCWRCSFEPIFTMVLVAWTFQLFFFFFQFPHFICCLPSSFVYTGFLNKNRSKTVQHFSNTCNGSALRKEKKFMYICCNCFFSGCLLQLGRLTAIFSVLLNSW